MHHRGAANSYATALLGVGLLTPDGTLRTDVANPTGNFMSITGASTGRDIRFGLRIAF